MEFYQKLKWHYKGKPVFLPESQQEFILLIVLLHFGWVLGRIFFFFSSPLSPEKLGDLLTFFCLLAHSLFLPLQSLIKSSWPLGVLVPNIASHALCPLVKEWINKLNSLFEGEFGMLFWWKLIFNYQDCHFTK